MFIIFCECVCWSYYLSFLSRRLGNRAFLQTCIFTCHFLVCKVRRRGGGTSAFVLSWFFHNILQTLSQRNAGERNGICLRIDLRICFPVSCECRNGFWCLEAALSHCTSQKLCLWFCSSQPAELCPAQQNPHSHCQELKFSRLFCCQHPSGAVLGSTELLPACQRWCSGLSGL